MSLLLKNFKPKQILHLHKVLIPAQNEGVRNSHWLPDYIPGPYPKTKEEREAAAKKYHLLPEEYKTYPNDDRSCGDYPLLPFESVDARDPWHPWDFPEIRKDFKDPVHFKIIHLLPENLSTRQNTAKLFKEALIFIAVSTTFLYSVYLTTRFETIPPECKKQYPSPGVVHYTFDIKPE